MYASLYFVVKWLIFSCIEFVEMLSDLRSKLFSIVTKVALQKRSDRFYPKLVVACIYIDVCSFPNCGSGHSLFSFHKSETEDKALAGAPQPPPVMKSREVVFNTKSMEFQTEDSSSRVNPDGEVEISVHTNSTTTRNEASFSSNSTGGNEESLIKQLEPTEGNFWSHSSTSYFCWQMDDYLLLPNTA